MTRPLRVLHLTGSSVDDFFGDLSRLYAADALTATADPERYEQLVAVVFPDGRWSFPSGLGDDAVSQADLLSPRRRSPTWAASVSTSWSRRCSACPA